MSVTRILHRGGNFRDLLPFASHPGVDALEADIWVRGERLVAHHDRPLGPLPFTIGRSGLHRRPDEPVDLDEILAAVHEQAEVVLDLRSWFADPAPELARELLSVSDRAHISVTCEVWAIADRLSLWVPDLQVAYSVRSDKQLARYLKDHGGRPTPVPVAIRHDLIRSADDLDSLREVAGRVTAWTVDDPERAIELVAWGIDAIVSNRLVVLNAV